MPGRGCQEACIISHMMSVPSLYSKHTLIHSPTHINRQVHTYEGLSHSHQFTTHTHIHTHTHTHTHAHLIGMRGVIESGDLNGLRRRCREPVDRRCTDAPAVRVRRACV